MERSSYTVVRRYVLSSMAHSIEETEGLLKEVENEATAQGSPTTRTSEPAGISRSGSWHSEQQFPFRIKRVARRRARAVFTRFLGVRIREFETTAAGDAQHALDKPGLVRKVIAALRDGLHSVRRALETNTDKIVKALRWGYWLPGKVRLQRRPGLRSGIYNHESRRAVCWDAVWPFQHWMKLLGISEDSPIRGLRTCLDTTTILFSWVWVCRHGTMRTRAGWRSRVSTQIEVWSAVLFDFENSLSPREPSVLRADNFSCLRKDRTGRNRLLLSLAEVFQSILKTKL